MHQPLDRAHGVVADRIVALGGIADELTRIGHELARDRVARVFGADQRGQRRRKADRVTPGEASSPGSRSGSASPASTRSLGLVNR